MSFGPTPDWGALLEQWWGGDFESTVGLCAFSAANNIIIGTNPPYQISDFLAFYPKFGTGVQGVTALSLGAGGSGYLVNDVLTLVQPDASGCLIQVNTVSGGGAILTWTVQQPGTGYSVANLLAVTGGAGTGATFNVTVISPLVTLVPAIVLQTYINLASASLSQARWADSWRFAMALFVAHYMTLYLRSEGNPGSTPGAIARSGLEAGIVVSSSAGDVSKTIEVPKGLEDFGAWTETEYGVQLATQAKIIGMGPMYIRGF